MKSLSDGLPTEIARKIHPDWRRNETDYWAKRDELLAQYHGQWIGFANGRILVSGMSPVEVFHKAQATGEHPFVTCVGYEQEPSRMRRAMFTYDSTYPGEALPVVTAEFRASASKPGLVVQQVIADTGADASALPWADCEQMNLNPEEGAPGLMGGVGDTTVATVVFPAWVHLDSKVYACRLQADFAGRERILGRDVLNRLDVLFRGPAREVVVNP